jgi:acetyl-CoA C-acetyltransferase
MEKKIKDRLAILGMGCTKFGERWDKSANDLMVDACYEAFEDAGVEPQQIQAAWVGTSSTGRTGRLLSTALKLEYACATGVDAFRNACFSVLAGVYDMVLVCGIEKLKDSGFAGNPPALENITSEVEPPSPPPVQFAMSATRYFHHYGLSFDEGKRLLAKIAVKNHHNGSMNPKAHFHREVTLEQAIKGPMIAWPLGLFDCCGVSDGSAAAIITTPEIAKKYRDDFILVKGLGLACGAGQGTIRDDWDFVHFPENVKAGQMAYAEAGITNPREEIDVAVVHDCFTITEMILYEDLQFSPRGEAKKDIESGFFELTGGLPVNTDGGLKCFGHPIGATGLRIIYEIYKQLQDKCGPRQVKNAKIGLTHALGGRPGSFTGAVGIFGRRD